MNDKRGKSVRQPTGGLSFFFSYTVLFFLATCNLWVLAHLLPNSPVENIALSIGSILVGTWFAHSFLRGQISVLIHEYKHAILATLVGNKWKKLKLDGMSGVFQYSYSKETAGYNAFISVAPYFLPVLSFISLFFFFLIKQKSNHSAIFLVAVVHGIELYLNFKDVSPIQTDLTDIRGGYWVGVGYVLVSNTFITSLLLIGLIGGSAGLEQLGEYIWMFGLAVGEHVRAQLY